MALACLRNASVTTLKSQGCKCWRIDDFHAVGSMPDEEVLPLSLRECESQLVGSYLKITVYHHFVVGLS